MFQKNYASLETLMSAIASEVRRRATIAQQLSAGSARAFICLRNVQNYNYIWSSLGVCGCDNRLLIIFHDIPSLY